MVSDQIAALLECLAIGAVSGAAGGAALWWLANRRKNADDGYDAFTWSAPPTPDVDAPTSPPRALCPVCGCWHPPADRCSDPDAAVDAGDAA